MTEHTEAEFPPCPECASEFTYESGALLACPMCGHEWSADDEGEAAEGGGGAANEIRDANGNLLQDGDDVTVIKSVKIDGGGGGTVKAGTKVRGIRLTADRGDGHDIDAKIAGIGRIQLKSSIVKKS